MLRSLKSNTIDFKGGDLQLSVISSHQRLLISIFTVISKIPQVTSQLLTSKFLIILILTCSEILALIDYAAHDW